MTNTFIHVDLAPSRRAKCQECKCLIAKGVLRVGFILHLEPVIHKEQWYHLSCMSCILYEFQHIEIEDVQGLDQLPINHRDNFREVFKIIKSQYYQQQDNCETHSQSQSLEKITKKQCVHTHYDEEADEQCKKKMKTLITKENIQSMEQVLQNLVKDLNDHKKTI